MSRNKWRLCQTARIPSEIQMSFPCSEVHPSEGLPRMAYLGPWARVGSSGGVGGFREFSAFGASHKGPWAHGPMGPGPMGPWPHGPRAQAPTGPGPLWEARNAENSRNPPTPRPNPRPGAEMKQSGEPLTGIRHCFCWSKRTTEIKCSHAFVLR